ncbi:MAG: phosphoenolpyruvate synthase regulatory protein [Legionellales bacterium]|nr:phosphoenolpyruvate synthase regulatory protein [Legionellales bacterium]|tara:strand:+ start:212 stop:1024 length:813 start_codon:yes stop_codon:yes gene_type:complete
MKHQVFFVSDSTGITAATLGNSLLTQFKNIKFEKLTLPFIDTAAKAQEAVTTINHACDTSEGQVFIFATIIDKDIQAIISQCKGVFMDIFNTFIQPIEEALKVTSSHSIGLTHGVQNYDQYHHRIDAVNYTLSCDDGLGIQNYDEADIILVGVSRCGKTPTSLYLALHFGLYVANYPFNEEELDKGSLPDILKPYRKKLFGLTIEPERLHMVRNKRRPDSRYAKLKQCSHELQAAEEIFVRERLPYIDTSNRSIEEIGATIMIQAGLKQG